MEEEEKKNPLCHEYSTTDLRAQLRIDQPLPQLKIIFKTLLLDLAFGSRKLDTSRCSGLLGQSAPRKQLRKLIWILHRSRVVNIIGSSAQIPIRLQFSQTSNSPGTTKTHIPTLCHERELQVRDRNQRVVKRVYQHATGIGLHAGRSTQQVANGTAQWCNWGQVQWSPSCDRIKTETAYVRDIIASLPC